MSVIRQSIGVDEDYGSGWSFAAARVPAMFAAARRPGEEDLEHAAGRAETLCGIPMDDVVVYRHPFFADRSIACPSCRDEAAKVPAEPCVQERLCNVLGRTEGPLRDELCRVLRAGAKVPFWVTGPGRTMVKHYVNFNEIVEGREAVAALAEFDGRLGVARVADAPGRRFLVLMPHGGVPVVALEAGVETMAEAFFGYKRL
jgi:hypothetical protein